MGNLKDEATHIDIDGYLWKDVVFDSEGNAKEGVYLEDTTWLHSYIKELKLKPIEKKEMKEFLVKQGDKWTLQLLDSDTEENSYRVAVPKDATEARLNKSRTINFIRADGCWMNEKTNGEWFMSMGHSEHEIIWQRSEDFTKVTIDELKHRVGVDATLAERQATYGSFEDVAFVTENVMGVLSKVRPNGLNDLPNTHRMALYMIASKMARIVNGDFNHLDSWHDIGGYAKLIENLIGDEDD